MSTYAVFGMTRHHAIDMAKKIANKKCVPESEWDELVNENANAVMQSRQIVRLSEKFDAPQFALDFRDIAKRSESRDLHIKAYCQADGKTLTGKPKMHWVGDFGV